jgi:hypothetical protein
MSVDVITLRQDFWRVVAPDFDISQVRPGRYDEL